MIKDLLFGMFASTFLFVLAHVFEQGLFISGLLSIALYTGLKLSLNDKQPELSENSGIRIEEVEKECQRAKELLDQLKEKSSIHECQNLEIPKIDQLSRHILSIVEHKPEKIHQVRDFTQLFLPKVAKLCMDYLELQGFKSSSAEQKNALHNFENETLPKVIERLEKNLQDCMQDDFSQLSSESKALEWLSI